MTSTDLSEYKDLFDTTAHEYLIALKKALEELRKDPLSSGAISTAYISAHSLKSQSLVMGYEKTGELCKTLEAIFSQIKDKQIALTPLLLKKIEQIIAEIDESLTAIKNSGHI